MDVLFPRRRRRRRRRRHSENSEVPVLLDESGKTIFEFETTS